MTPPCRTLDVADGIESTGTTMDALASLVAAVTGQRGVNETGLSGHYKFKLHFAKTRLNTGTPNELPDVGTALKEIGLTLVRRSTPIPVLVVDRIQPPKPD